MPTNPKIAAFLAKWECAETSERANAKSFLIEFCHALEVEPPRPRGTGYEFEFEVRKYVGQVPGDRPPYLLVR